MSNLKNIQINNDITYVNSWSNKKRVKLKANPIGENNKLIPDYPLELSVENSVIWKVVSNEEWNIDYTFEIDSPDKNNIVTLQLKDIQTWIVNSVRVILQKNIQTNNPISQQNESNDNTWDLLWTFITENYNQDNEVHTNITPKLIEENNNKENWPWMYLIKSKNQNEDIIIMIYVEKSKKTWNWIFFDWDVRVLIWWNLTFSNNCRDIKLYDDTIAIQEANYFLDTEKVEFISNPEEIKTITKNFNNILTKNFILNNLWQNGLLLWKSSYRQYKNDKVIVLASVKQNGLAIQNASDELKNDDDIIRTALTNNYLAYEFLSPEKKACMEFRNYYIGKINQNNELRRMNEKSVVLAAVRQNGLAIQNASDELKNDDDIIRTALTNNYLAYEFLSPEKKACSEYFTHYKEQKWTCEYTLSHNWMALWEEKYKKFQDDKFLVMLAISQNWLALQFASDKLKNDPDVVITAVKQNWLAYRFITREYFKLSKEVILAAINSNIQVFDYFWDEIKNDPNFMVYVIRKDPTKFDSLNENLKQYLNIILALASRDLLNAISKFPQILQDVRFIKELLRLYERSVLNQVINMNKDAIIRLTDGIKYVIFMSYKEVAIHLIKITAWAILHSSNIKSNLIYLRDLVIIDKEILHYFPLEIKKNKDFKESLETNTPEYITQIRELDRNLSQITSWEIKTAFVYLLKNWDEKIKNIVQNITQTRNLNFVDSTRYNLLMALISSGKQNYDKYTLTLLDQENINVNQLWEDNATPLNLAIKFKKYWVAQKILEKDTLYLFKKPKWSGFNSLASLMRQNWFPTEIIEQLKNHPKNTLINRLI